MRRVPGTLLALLAALAVNGTPALHVHAYVDHDHPEHHHGPASHAHAQGDDHDEGHGDAHGPQWEQCEPARHAISIVVACTDTPRVSVLAMVSGSPLTPPPVVQITRARHVLDVRVHGPPEHAQTPPRAPPLALLA